MTHTANSILELHSSNIKSYATESNLVKALGKIGNIEKSRYLICKTTDGRWTAVFVGVNNLHIVGVSTGFAMVS